MSRRPPNRQLALVSFSISILVLGIGIALAAQRYPGGYDWAYKVMSALASRKHNPEGGAFFAAGLSLSIAALWPTVAWIGFRHGRESRPARLGRRAVAFGCVCGFLIGVERLVFFSLSELVHNAHELLAILCFLALYTGIVAFQIDRKRRDITTWLPATFAITPLVAIGLSQLAIYFDQRDLGWVKPSWREMGVPVWYSLAFWQWLAAVVLWASLGYLAAASRPKPARD